LAIQECCLVSGVWPWFIDRGGHPSFLIACALSPASLSLASPAVAVSIVQVVLLSVVHRFQKWFRFGHSHNKEFIFCLRQSDVDLQSWR
jgi:hypothetical protein